MKRMQLVLPLLATAGLVLAAQPGWSREPSASLDLARQLNEAFVAVAEKVSPAVVVITVVQESAALSPADEPNSPFDTLPHEFWRYFHKQLEQQQPETVRGEGSGVIIRDDGYILTNGHVVEDAQSIRVRLRDGRIFPAKVRGIDTLSDLAVIRIEATRLPVAVLADSSKTRVGEFAIAIGAPFDLDYSVTFGHVSAKGRSNILQGYGALVMDQDFIQTDALMNPGNSGGPLVNINGEVMGINTVIRGLHSGIGFSIPSSLAREVSDHLIAEGKFTRARLGVAIRALRDDPDLRESLKGVDEGVVVDRILAGGPAAKSDLERDDIITAIDGKPVATAHTPRRNPRQEARSADHTGCLPIRPHRPWQDDPGDRQARRVGRADRGLRQRHAQPGHRGSGCRAGRHSSPFDPRASQTVRCGPGRDSPERGKGHPGRSQGNQTWRHHHLRQSAGRRQREAIP